MVNSVISSGEEDGGGLCGIIAPFTSGLYDIFFFFWKKVHLLLGKYIKKIYLYCITNIAEKGNEAFW